MSAVLDRFAESYRSIFERYVREPGEADLEAAYELGREAVARELSALDLAAIHHDVLLRAVRGGETGGVEQVVQAASQFFLDILSAFEVAQRALREAREQAALEKKQAAIVRRLSSFLADASLAVDAAGSVEEALQLVAEHAREIVDADCCIVGIDAAAAEAVAHAPDEQSCVALAGDVDLTRLYEAVASENGAVRLSVSELERHSEWQGAPEARAWLAAPLTRLDGQRLGLIHLFARRGGRVSELDEAVVVQLAQMASAALERAETYRTRSGSPA